MKMLESKLRKGSGMAHVERDKQERKSARTEACCEELVEKLKNELCSMVHENQEEGYLEVKNMRKKIDDEFKLDVRDECFEESDKDEESEKDMQRYDEVEIEDMVESEEEKQHGESEEKEESENGDFLFTMFDAQCLIFVH